MKEGESMSYSRGAFPVLLHSRTRGVGPTARGNTTTLIDQIKLWLCFASHTRGFQLQWSRNIVIHLRALRKLMSQARNFNKHNPLRVMISCELIRSVLCDLFINYSIPLSISCHSKPIQGIPTHSLTTCQSRHPRSQNRHRHPHP